MTLDLFHGQGAFNPEELEEFIKIYEENGRHDWVTPVDFGDEATPNIQKLVNEMGQTMGNLTDRLALTIVQLNKRKLSQHAGDCTIYASLDNGTPEAGVCTCGYGMQVMRETGDNKELYSTELREGLVSQGGGI